MSAILYQFSFAVSSSISCWDGVMFNRTTQWFSSFWMVCVFFLVLLQVYLGDDFYSTIFLNLRRGSLEMVNENHIMTLGKFVFWLYYFLTYLLVSPVSTDLLCNIPEDQFTVIEN